MRSIPELTQALHARGGKVTPQRLLIYQVLSRSRQHPTAEAIHEQVLKVLPMVSLTTVYKTLNELVALGEVKRFDVNGISHFDPNTEPHGEAVCLTCGRITDVAQSLPEVGESLDGFEVTSAALIFYGHCPECRMSLDDRVDPEQRGDG